MIIILQIIIIINTNLHFILLVDKKGMLVTEMVIKIEGIRKNKVDGLTADRK